MLFLVVGPSGAGKDTLIDAARRELAGDARYRFVCRDITRPREAGGEEHNPIDADTFSDRRETGAYALHWCAHGLGYGIPADIVPDVQAGRVVVANVSRSVIEDAARRFPVRVLEITAPPALLAQRLGARGRESMSEIAARLARRMTLPPSIEVVTVVNDGTPQQGAARVLAELRRATAAAAPG
jgi:phosphonate metabolism protein PhnN/1,5-bisphosphokinase (PRPP-forming)